MRHDVDIPFKQKLISVLWPAFIVASLQLVAVTAAVDPLVFFNQLGMDYLSRTAAYSIGFFFFWVTDIACAAATLYFLLPVAEVEKFSGKPRDFW